MTHLTLQGVEDCTKTRKNPASFPVKAFELYLSKLNPSLDSLWQRPKAFDNFNEFYSVWYCNAPLGKNTLGSLMKTISVEYKLSKVYTNHCIRSTAVSVLDNINNFEARHIMRVSGHKSGTSIRSYSRQLTECKQRENFTHSYFCMRSKHHGNCSSKYRSQESSFSQRRFFLWL